MKVDAEKIKELRIAKQLSQRELASLIGVTSAAVSNWESGTRRQIREESLSLLAAALDVGLPDLLVQSDIRAKVTPTDELQLVAAFRQLSAEHKVIALRLVRALSGAASSAKERA